MVFHWWLIMGNDIIDDGVRNAFSKINRYVILVDDQNSVLKGDVFSNMPYNLSKNVFQIGPYDYNFDSFGAKFWSDVFRDVYPLKDNVGKPLSDTSKYILNRGNLLYFFTPYDYKFAFKDDEDYDESVISPDYMFDLVVSVCPHNSHKINYFKESGKYGVKVNDLRQAYSLLDDIVTKNVILSDDFRNRNLSAVLEEILDDYSKSYV